MGGFAHEKAVDAYRAATTSAALFDLSDWTTISISGPDRASYLHNFCTNEIKKLSAGEGCEAFVATIKGRILGHVLVFVEAESLTLLAVPGANDVLMPHLTKYLIGVEAEVMDRAAETGVLCVAGPKALETVGNAFSQPADFDGCVTPNEKWVEAAGELGLAGQPGIGPLQAERLQQRVGANVRVGQRKDWLIGRTEFFAVPGFVVIGPRAGLDRVAETLKQNGAVAAGPQVFEALRIEAGFPWAGRDVSEENIAQEAGRTEQAISFTKGCYLGQEPIARLDAMGHTNRELRTILLESPEVPEAGTPVLHGGIQVGVITSAALSPARNQAVALAVLKIAAAKSGTPVAVVLGEVELRGTVDWPRPAKEE